MPDKPNAKKPRVPTASSLSSVRRAILATRPKPKTPDLLPHETKISASTVSELNPRLQSEHMAGPFSLDGRDFFGHMKNGKLVSYPVLEVTPISSSHPYWEVS
jgi:hypothetical protein